MWVFTHVSFESRDTTFGLWAGACTRVLHAPSGTVLWRTPRPRRTMRLRPASLRYRLGTDIPDVLLDSNRLAPPLDDVTIADDRLEAWWETRFDLHGAAPRDRRHPVWGGAHHRLLGYVDTPNGATGRCWRRTADSADAWRHLLTIGYDYTVGFEVADGGKLQIAIAPRDLRQGRFDRVCGIFDSA